MVHLFTIMNYDVFCFGLKEILLPEIICISRCRGTMCLSQCVSVCYLSHMKFWTPAPVASISVCCSVQEMKHIWMGVVTIATNES